MVEGLSHESSETVTGPAPSSLFHVHKLALTHRKAIPITLGHQEIVKPLSQITSTPL